MTNPRDQQNPTQLHGLAANVVWNARQQILKDWELVVRKDMKEARELSGPILLDRLPEFISNLAVNLNESAPRQPLPAVTAVAQEHGCERAKVTRFGPDQILREYQVLKAVVEKILDLAGALSEEAFATVQACFERAIQEAMAAYFLVHSQMRDQFVATLTHDLRNPLGTAKMAAELIADNLVSIVDLALRQEMELLCGKMVSNLKRTDRMIQNLLDSNAAQFGEHLNLNLGPGDMLAVVNSVLSDLGESDRKRVRVEGSSITGIWDVDAIWRAIENLITNAFKYGSAKDLVTIHLSTNLGRALLSVHNQGNPIPEEDQPLLFQAFRRSESAKQSGQPGWGLGLAQVRGVAESHGGHLSLESTEKNGTIFTINIPLDSRPFQQPLPK